MLRNPRSGRAAATLIAVAKTIQKPPSRQPARFVEPMQCLAVAKLPEGPNWEYEIKFDGYRALGIKSAGRVGSCPKTVMIFQPASHRSHSALSKLPDDSIVDGEIVAWTRPATLFQRFTKLQLFRHVATVLCLRFLHLTGKNLRDRPLDERRELLCAKVMPRMPEDVPFRKPWRPRRRIVAAVKKQGLEGVIAKRRDSLYEPGRRSGAWVKMRINKGQELVIGGYVPSAKELRLDHRRLLRRRQPHLCSARSKRICAGASGEGVRAFSQARNQSCPFSNLPQRDKGRWGQGLTGGQDGGMPLAKPELVAQIEYTDWTDVNHLRHSKFIALRDDKPAKDVRCE